MYYSLRLSASTFEEGCYGCKDWKPSGLAKSASTEMSEKSRDPTLTAGNPSQMLPNGCRTESELTALPAARDATQHQGGRRTERRNKPNVDPKVSPPGSQKSLKSPQTLWTKMLFAFFGAENINCIWQSISRYSHCLSWWWSCSQIDQIDRNIL